MAERNAWSERLRADDALDTSTDLDDTSDTNRDSLTSASAEATARIRHLRALIGHLTLLLGPPTDGQVRNQLPIADCEARELAATASGTDRGSLLATVERDEALHRAWLIDLDPTPRDAVTGLPEAAVQAHQTVSVPGFGQMPVGLGEARARAWLAADNDERRRAAAVAQRPYNSLDENACRFRAAQHGMRRAGVSEFVRFVHKVADQSPEVRDLVAAWHQGELRALVRQFLDDSEL
jgi:hypothetical protein